MPGTIMAARMLKPVRGGGRGGAPPSGAATSLGAASCRVIARRAYVPLRPPEMVDGPVPGPEPPSGPAGQAPGHEGLGRPHRRRAHRRPARQVRRDGRRQRAPRAVVVAGDHPHRLEHGDPFGAGHDVVGRIGEVAPLHHHVAGAPGPDQLGRLGHGRHAHQLVHVDAGQGGRLPQVGGDHEGVGEQALEVRRQPVGRHQRLPAGGDQHRVDDQLGQPSRRGQIGHDVDDAPVGQHAGLDAPARRSRRAPPRSAGGRSRARGPPRRAPRPCSARSPPSAPWCRGRRGRRRS